MTNEQLDFRLMRNSRMVTSVVKSLEKVLKKLNDSRKFDRKNDAVAKDDKLNVSLIS